MPTFTRCTRCNARQQFQFAGDFKQEPCPKCGCETADIEIIGESDIKLENMHFVGRRNAQRKAAQMLNVSELRLRESILSQSDRMQNVAPGSPLYDKVMGTNHHEEWAKAYAEARASHAAGEPLILTVCKIATRILLVIMLVGMAVAVML